MKTHQDQDIEKLAECAEFVKNRCLQAALEAYQYAAMRGVCHEGAWEAATGSIQSLDVEAIVRELIGRERADA